jgi:hypothetical protein
VIQKQHFAIVDTRGRATATLAHFLPDPELHEDEDKN